MYDGGGPSGGFDRVCLGRLPEEVPVPVTVISDTPHPDAPRVKGVGVRQGGTPVLTGTTEYGPCASTSGRGYWSTRRSSVTPHLPPTQNPVSDLCVISTGPGTRLESCPGELDDLGRQYSVVSTRSSVSGYTPSRDTWTSLRVLVPPRRPRRVGRPRSVQARDTRGTPKTLGPDPPTVPETGDPHGCETVWTTTKGPGGTTGVRVPGV